MKVPSLAPVCISRSYSEPQLRLNSPGQETAPTTTGTLPPTGLPRVLRLQELMSVRAAALFAAGITAGAPVATLQVRSSGYPVAFSASTADGVHLNAGDKVEFYERGTDTRTWHRQ